MPRYRSTWIVLLYDKVRNLSGFIASVYVPLQARRWQPIWYVTWWKRCHHWSTRMIYMSHR